MNTASFTLSFKRVAYAPILEIVRRTWQIWIPIFSFLLGFGIIQVEFIRVVIPGEWTRFILAAFALLGTVTALLLALRDNVKLSKEITELQNKLIKLQDDAIPVLVIEGIPIYALMSHFAKRLSDNSKNNVILDVLKLTIQVHGTTRVKDATLTWRFKGKNIAGETLTSFYTSISSENAIPMTELRAMVYDIRANGRREAPRVPRLLSDDSTFKDLLLPFKAPGIISYESFDIEFTYTWPSIVNPKKDYWFVEPIKYANEVRQLNIAFEYPANSTRAALVFSLDASNKQVLFIGSLEIKYQPAHDSFQYQTNATERGKIYLIIVETND